MTRRLLIAAVLALIAGALAAVAVASWRSTSTGAAGGRVEQRKGWTSTPGQPV